MGANRRNKYFESRRFAPSYRLMDNPDLRGEYVHLLMEYNNSKEKLKDRPCKETYDHHIIMIQKISEFIILHQKNFKHG